MDKQVVGIIGMGPVGTILGAYLARSGVRVYGVELGKERAAQVNQDGFRIQGYATLDAMPEGCFTRLEDLAKVEDLTAVFLCTKTWAIPSVMRTFVGLDWPEPMRFVSFQNGIGPEDKIGEYVDKSRVCRGVVNYAGNLTPEGVATMNWFHPPNLLGPATDREASWGPKIETLLSDAGLTTVAQSHHEIKKAAFFKTILNSALNALCSAQGLTMGQAMRLKHTRRTARALLREGITVAALVGYNYGEDTLDRCIEYLEAGGDHYPSMWFDLKQRTPTEIEYINGKIVKIGRMFRDVTVDLNQYFTSAIITQEIKNGTREEEDVPEYLING